MIIRQAYISLRTLPHSPLQYYFLPVYARIIDLMASKEQDDSALFAAAAEKADAAQRRSQLAQLTVAKRDELTAAESKRKHGRPTKKVADHTYRLRNELSRLQAGLLPGEAPPPNAAVC